MEKRKKYTQIFLTCFYISSFTFGGGLVIVSLMKDKFANKLKWIKEKEILDLVSIAQASPGSIAVNTSILLGYKMGGILGALVALVGTVLPPLIIISLISIVYNFIKGNVVVEAVFAGMRAAVAALVIDVLITMSLGVVKERNILSIAIMIIAFVLLFFFKVNVIYVVLAAIGIGILLAILNKKKIKEIDTPDEQPKEDMFL